MSLIQLFTTYAIFTIFTWVFCFVEREGIASREKLGYDELNVIFFFFGLVWPLVLLGLAGYGLWRATRSLGRGVVLLFRRVRTRRSGIPYARARTKRR